MYAEDRGFNALFSIHMLLQSSHFPIASLRIAAVTPLLAFLGPTCIGGANEHLLEILMKKFTHAIVRRGKNAIKQINQLLTSSSVGNILSLTHNFVLSCLFALKKT